MQKMMAPDSFSENCRMIHDATKEQEQDHCLCFRVGLANVKARPFFLEVHSDSVKGNGHELGNSDLT